MTGPVILFSAPAGTRVSRPWVQARRARTSSICATARLSVASSVPGRTGTSRRVVGMRRTASGAGAGSFNARRHGAAFGVPEVQVQVSESAAQRRPAAGRSARVRAAAAITIDMERAPCRQAHITGRPGPAFRPQPGPPAAKRLPYRTDLRSRFHSRLTPCITRVQPDIGPLAIGSVTSSMCCAIAGCRGSWLFSRGALQAAARPLLGRWRGSGIPCRRYVSSQRMQHRACFSAAEREIERIEVPRVSPQAPVRLRAARRIHLARPSKTHQEIKERDGPPSCARSVYSREAQR